MLDFLRAGLRSLHAAEELFSRLRAAAGRVGGNRSPARAGPNDETIVYLLDQVQICAPVPNPARVGTAVEIACGEGPEYEAKLAAVIGKQGMDIKSLEARPYIAGFTGMNELGARLSAPGVLTWSRRRNSAAPTD